MEFVPPVKWARSRPVGQSEGNDVRSLFARTTTAARSQEDGRWNHREADRHLPQQFCGSRADHADVAFRMGGGYASVLSHDGQGGAVLREVSKMDKFDGTGWRTLEAVCGDVQQLSSAMAAALATCTRGDVAILVRRVLCAELGNGLHFWRAVTWWFRAPALVEQRAPMTRLISPGRTNNAGELQVAVIQWELAQVEHESKFTEDRACRAA